MTPSSAPDDRPPADATDGASDGSPPDADTSPSPSPDDPPEEYGPTEGPAGREVVVPADLYKTVTVMSTLLAIATVVGGFVLLDTATNRAQASFSDIDPLLALFGLGLIVGGAAAYAYSTRFRAAGMGTSAGDDGSGPEDDDEGSEADKTDAA